jgi:hypothetical protein
VVIRENRVYRNNEVIWEAPAELALPDFLRGAYDHFSGQYPKFHKMDHLSKLGWLAAEVLLHHRPFGQYAPEQVGLVFANRSASLDADLRYFDSIKEFPSPALFVYTLANIVMGEISIRHGFKGENVFFTADRYDEGFLVDYTKQLMEEGAISAALCGWIEVMGNAYEVILHQVETK